MSTATKPREVPMLFSQQFIAKLLDGTKTQTRRPLSYRNCTVQGYPAKGYWPGLRLSEGIVRNDNPMLMAITGKHEPGRDVHLSVPYAAPGDRKMKSEDLGRVRVRPNIEVGDVIWVRETWQQIQQIGRNEYRTVHRTEKLDWATPIYMAGYEGHEPPRWMPSIHMPRWAARIFLLVTDVRVERIQEITQAGARAEGIADGGCLNCGQNEPCGCQQPMPCPTESFIREWHALYGESGILSWNANPWVSVTTFELVNP